ncbi:hypothetical protein NLO95_14770 [Pseudomonas syringae]|nr:hypothetical protein [Pseudomonas syringae]
MRAEQRKDSVQSFTIDKITDEHSIIFNDDGKGKIVYSVAVGKTKTSSTSTFTTANSALGRMAWPPSPQLDFR